MSGWLIGILLVSRCGLGEVFITMVFTCHLLSWCKISNPFREIYNVIGFLFPFHIVMCLANLCFIRLQEYFPILRTRSCPDLYLIILPPRMSLEVGRGRILIPGLYLPLGGVDRGFPFTEDETQGISHTSGTLENIKVIVFMKIKWCKWWVISRGKFYPGSWLHQSL